MTNPETDRQVSKLTRLERKALTAAEHSDGWCFFYPGTARKLSVRGLLKAEQHPSMGQVLRITDLGRAALANGDEGK